MKRRLRTLFYGVTHEHAYGKFETLKRLADDFEVIALVDDRPRGTPRSLDERLDVEQAVRDGFRVVTEAEADGLLDGGEIDVAFVETANADLMEVAAKLVGRDVQRIQHAAPNAVLLGKEREEQMLGTDIMLPRSA